MKLPKICVSLVSSKRLTNPKTGDLTALYEAIARHLKNDYPSSEFEPFGSIINDTFIATGIQETAPMCTPVNWLIESVKEMPSVDTARPAYKSRYRYLVTLKSSFSHD